jgi:putrescine transport system substrate-binding protein
MTMAHLGLDPAALTAENIDAAVAAILAVRPSIQTFDNANFLNTLPTSEVCVANTFAGDYAMAMGRAMEAGIEVNPGYFIPSTRAPVWVDNFCILSDAAHVGKAHVFLNYLLRPEVIAATSNYTYYANANLASRASPSRIPVLRCAPIARPSLSAVTNCSPALKEPSVPPRWMPNWP